MGTSKRAQKSEVHQTTDDASSSPASDARTPKRKGKSRPAPAPAPRGKQPSRGYERDAIDSDLNLAPGSRARGRAGSRARARAAPNQEIEGQIGGGPGAGDASSGGGAGAGIPGGGTDLRMGDKIPKGNVKRDRQRLFPESPRPKRPTRRRDDSDLGGPVHVNTDEQGNLKD